MAANKYAEFFHDIHLLECEVDSKSVHPIDRERGASTFNRSVVRLHAIDGEEVLTTKIDLESAGVKEVADLLRHLIGDFCRLQAQE